VRRALAALAALVATAALAAPAAAQAVRGSYLYTLSSFTGPIPYNHSRVAVDRERNEVYVLYQNTVRVFNESGMEVYQFGDDLDLGHLVDVAVDDRGDILLLAWRDGKPAIVRCDYRGRPQARSALTGLPDTFSDFAPNRLVFQRGELYLASSMGLQVVRADREGNFLQGYDLFTLFELEEKDRGAVELGGFGVDAAGNILLTAPVLFRAFVLAPDGTLSAFGKAGGAPGRFNIAGGITRDSKGNLLVVDKLKGAVLVFTGRFEFVAQFAARGYKPGELIYPDDLAIDGRDRVYVTQAGKRGISVFKLAHL